MKLRNKKTGEVKDWDFGNWYQTILNPENEEKYECNLNDFIDRTVEFREEWEDYKPAEEIKPAEPLIKDERIRKAVRSWAEANKINKCKCSDETHCITFETERGMFISFEYADPIPPEGNFTITELCGEEEKSNDGKN